VNSNIEFAFCEEIKLFGEQEKIATSKSLLLFGGLTIAVWVAVSTSVFWVIYPAYGWFFRSINCRTSATCPIGAIFCIDNEEPSIVESNFFHGCGDCKSMCPADAVSLKNC